MNPYSGSERLLHKLAFLGAGAQVALADIEDRLFGRELAHTTIESPVFVTALPRAGTTILLSLLRETGEFASHTYRCMPFVLCPILWSRVSRPLWAKGRETERAHGDGVKVSPDSAEAFEEVVWRQFWGDQYKGDRIEPWSTRRNAEFESFLRSHIGKILWLEKGGGEARYLSKNNMNIARLSYLAAVFPDAEILVPFRPPLQHAASLLKQHRRFLAIHREDAFAEQYMRAIGHYDFGANLRPINFRDWLGKGNGADASELSFWVKYWIAAYGSIVSNPCAAVRLFPYDQWIEHPRAGLDWLAATLKLRRPAELVDRYASVRPPATHEVDPKSLPGALVEEAESLFQDLSNKTTFGI